MSAEPTSPERAHRSQPDQVAAGRKPATSRRRSARRRTILTGGAAAGGAILGSSITGDITNIRSIALNTALAVSPPPPTPTPVALKNCSPGYWKNHRETWSCGYAPGAGSGNGVNAGGGSGATRFNQAFGCRLTTGPASNEPTLWSLLWANGGGKAAFLRHAVAALLNACRAQTDLTHPFPYSVDQVKSITCQAIAGATSSTPNSYWDGPKQILFGPCTECGGPACNIDN